MQTLMFAYLLIKTHRKHDEKIYKPSFAILTKPNKFERRPIYIV